MLTILGQKTRYCDGIARRSFLKIGAFSFGATTLSLADVFRAEANTGTSTAPRDTLSNDGRRWLSTPQVGQVFVGQVPVFEPEPAQQVARQALGGPG